MLGISIRQQISHDLGIFADIEEPEGCVDCELSSAIGLSIEWGDQSGIVMASLEMVVGPSDAQLGSHYLFRCRPSRRR